MEKKLTIEMVAKLKAGRQIIISIFGGTQTLSLIGGHKTKKYCVTIDGVVGRNNWIDGKLTFVSAESEGCTGEELHTMYSFCDFEGSSFIIHDTNQLEGFNARLIDKRHKDYKPKQESLAKEASAGLKTFIRHASKILRRSEKAK